MKGLVNMTNIAGFLTAALIACNLIALISVAALTAAILKDARVRGLRFKWTPETFLKALLDGTP
jgi:hypothetical protein